MNKIERQIKMEPIEEIKLQKEFIEKVKQLNNGKELKYNILTMGCQLNENDSEKLCGMLEEMGYVKTEKSEEADYLIHVVLEKMQKTGFLEN